MTQQLNGPALISDFDWTLDRYHRAISNGTLTPDDKLELLKGKLVKKMSINPPHASCLKKLTKYFNRRYLDQYELMSENPITLIDAASEPEPDFVVAALSEDDYRRAHPGAEDVYLVIEIADKSLQRDRTHKATIYAQAGIVEYWIINLKQERVEVFLHPDQDAGLYQSITHHKKGQVFESPFVGQVSVSDLLP